DDAVGDLTDHAQHPGAQRRAVDRHPRRRRGVEPEGAPLTGGEAHPLAVERLANPPDRLPHRGHRLDEGDAVPALDDHLGRGPDSQHRPSRRRLLERRRRHGDDRGPARVRRDDGGAQAGVRGEGRRVDEWREAVDARRLHRPEVGVAELLGLANDVAMLAQRVPEHGDGESVARHQMVGWMTMKNTSTRTSTPSRAPTAVPRVVSRWYSADSAPSRSSTSICLRRVGVYTAPPRIITTP